MNGIEDEVEEKQDYARPFFDRHTGEVGLYLDVDEAICVDAHAYGSDHLRRVDLNEKLGEYLAKRDLIKIKAELDRRGHFRGVVLEEFRRAPADAVLALVFDTLEALQDVCKLHEGKQLQTLFQTLLVDKAVHEALGVRKLTLRVRLWPDEVEACEAELMEMEKDKKREDINDRPRTLEVLDQVKNYQTQTGMKLREQLDDAVSTFEAKLRQFIEEVRRELPHTTTHLSTLREFQTNMKMALGADSKKPKKMLQVKHYLSTLDLMRTWLAQAEVHICLPLLQIPSRCETEKQRELKRQMRSTCLEVQKLLKPSVSLDEVRYPEWDDHLRPGEKKLLRGVVSLVPLGMEGVTDVDSAWDEYVNGFPLPRQPSVTQQT